MPEIPNDNRQPEITAVLTFSHRHARGRLGDFVAEIPHKVLSGIINVQRRHRFLVSYRSRSAWRLAACPVPLPDREADTTRYTAGHATRSRRPGRRPAKPMAILPNPVRMIVPHNYLCGREEEGRGRHSSGGGFSERHLCLRRASRRNCSPYRRTIAAAGSRRT